MGAFRNMMKQMEKEYDSLKNEYGILLCNIQEREEVEIKKVEDNKERYMKMVSESIDKELPDCDRFNTYTVLTDLSTSENPYFRIFDHILIDSKIDEFKEKIAYIKRYENNPHVPDVLKDEGFRAIEIWPCTKTMCKTLGKECEEPHCKDCNVVIIDELRKLRGL